MEEKFKIQINTNKSNPLEIKLEKSEILFLVGANGTGKSTLMQSINNTIGSKVVRILAHRQNWFTSNTVNLTQQDHNNLVKNMSDFNLQPYSRTRDDFMTARPNINIYSIIKYENKLGREVKKYNDLNNQDKLSELRNKPTIIDEINEIYKYSGLKLNLVLNNNDELFVHKQIDGVKYNEYNITELSDGEKNLLLLTAEVLNTEENSLILIDEPERHLHRSISSPMISSLILKRKDCSFIIATHDLNLLSDFNDSKVIILYRFYKNENFYNYKFFEHLKEIPSDLKVAILGSKNKILFTEGNDNSLDIKLYSILFPTFTILPVGSCNIVINYVKSIKNIDQLNHIEVFGIIDMDNRTSDEIKQLKNENILSKNYYSIESILFSEIFVKKVFEYCRKLLNIEYNNFINNLTPLIVKEFDKQKQFFCNIMIERTIHELIEKEKPNHKRIKDLNEFEINPINIKDFREKEELKIDKLINENNIFELIKRYPIKKSSVIETITKKLGLENYDFYKNIIFNELKNNDEFLNEIKENIFKDLTSILTEN